jgi:DMSO/TMAO reductase YedYZ molybdopterin-dependent catalytic subunit
MLTFWLGRSTQGITENKAVDRSLPGERVVVSLEPFNAETPLNRQMGVLTPARRHYVRNHFPIPTGWPGLAVDGAVDRPQTLTLDDLLALPARSLVVTLECAGNGRAFMRPPVAGEPWQLGAAGTAEWTGTPLRPLLERSGWKADAVEVVFEGADHGTPAGASGPIAYARSLPLDRALHPDTLLAYAMNGEPLLPEHGAPLRLLVPGWYGMASVKWLTRITLAREAFTGFYQVDRYVMKRNGERYPLGLIAMRAVITTPVPGAVVERRLQAIRGYAWCGAPAGIAGVEVSVDSGANWSSARLEPGFSPYAWRPWECEWEPTQAGACALLARAINSAGRRQPPDAPWNALGYANNAVCPITVTVH